MLERHRPSAAARRRGLLRTPKTANRGTGAWSADSPVIQRAARQSGLGMLKVEQLHNLGWRYTKQADQGTPEWVLAGGPMTPQRSTSTARLRDLYRVVTSVGRSVL